MDGSEVSTETTLTGDAFDKDQAVACELTPWDGEEAGEPVLSDAVTVLNTPPVATNAALSSTSPAEGDTLSVTVTGVEDDDGDDVDLLYAWYVDGTAVSTASTLDSGDFDKDQSIYVVVTPTDGLDAGTAVTSNTATAVNTAPAITVLDLSPAEPLTDDTLATSVSTTDADGDAVSLSYAWYVDSTLVSSTGSTLDGATWFDKDQDVYVIVTPNDGDEDGATSTSDTLTVLNTPPAITAVSLDPEEIYEEDEVLCSPEGWSDADGDAEGYLYSWTVDGVEVSTSDTLTGADFDKGQALVCTVTPDDGDDEGEPVASLAVEVDNTAPVLASATLSDTSPVEGDTLTVTLGTATDDDGDDISYSYDWYVDGTLVASTSSLTSDDFDKGDEIYVIVTPDDGTDFGEPVTSDLATAANTAPVISAVGLSPTSPATDDAVEASVTSSDEDGDSVSYTYAWYVDSTLVSGVSGDTLASTHFVKDQDIYVIVTPSDDEEDGSTYTSSSITAVNTPPSITGVSLSASVVYEDDTLTCSATGWSDADGDTAGYLYSWTISGTEVATTASVDGSTFDKGDTLVCTITPDDGDDTGTAVSSASITVDNTAPVLASATLSDTSPAEGDTLTVSLGTATDDDGDSISYSYDWYVEGTLVSSATSLTSDDFDKGDEIYVVVTPDDGTDSGAAVTSASATAVNTAPVASGVTISPTTAYTTTTLTATPAATDADGDTVSWTYAWTVDGSLVSGVTGSTLTGGYFSKDQVVSVEATPSDGADSGAAVSSSSLTISNSVPSITSVSLTPTTAYEGSTLTCAASGWSDADGDTAGYLYAWTVGGSAISATGATLSGTSFDKGDAVTCTITPDDGDDTGAAVASGSVSIANTAPVLASASLSDTSPAEGDTLSVSLGTASDADGDSISYTYAWFVDGTQVATTSTLTSASFDKHDDIYVVVTPSDGTDSGSAVTSDTATAVNTPPVMSGVSLSPSTLYTDTTVSASPSATDADGDSVSYAYAWVVDGTTVSATGTSLSGASWFDKGESVYVIVTPSDGDDDGTALSSSAITVSNSAPSAPGIALYPESPMEGIDDIWCSVDTASTDADGDSLSYWATWSVDSTSWTGASYTTSYTDDTIYSTDIYADEVWECTMHVSDGTDSASSTDSLTVVPETEVYYIDYADLSNLGSSCSSTPNEHVYNSCSGSWGFSWTDTHTQTPSSVTVDVYVGIDCDTSGGSTAHSTTLNGSSSGTFTYDTFHYCYCDVTSDGSPGSHEESFTLTDISAYSVGGSNTFLISSLSCDGLSTNSGWGGSYAYVTVDY